MHIVFILQYQKVQNIMSENSLNSVVLIVFIGVISAYTVTVSFCHSIWIRYQKCFIRSMT